MPMFHESSTGSYGREKDEVSGPFRDFSFSIRPLYVFQRLTQFMPRTVYVRLHGAERQIERCGDFLVRTPLDVSKHDARTVLGTETCDRPLDCAAELTGLHLVECGF